MRNTKQALWELSLLTSLSLLLFGCGFHSVYGTHDGSGSAAAEQLQQVAIDNIPNRSGQILRNALIDRMYGSGRPSQPQYELQIKLRTTESYVGLLANAVSTLSELDAYGDYVLTDMHGKELLRGSTHSQSSYNRLDDQYATLAAHDSAVERTVRELSEQIVNRLNVYFSNLPATAPPTTVPPAPAKP